MTIIRSRALFSPVMHPFLRPSPHPAASNRGSSSASVSAASADGGTIFPDDTPDNGQRSAPPAPAQAPDAPEKEAILLYSSPSVFPLPPPAHPQIPPGDPPGTPPDQSCGEAAAKPYNCGNE